MNNGKRGHSLKSESELQTGNRVQKSHCYIASGSHYTLWPKIDESLYLTEVKVAYNVDDRKQTQYTLPSFPHSISSSVKNSCEIDPHLALLIA